jgi:hypothetical protein
MQGKHGLHGEHRQVPQRDDGARPAESVDDHPAEVTRLHDQRAALADPPGRVGLQQPGPAVEHHRAEREEQADQHTPSLRSSVRDPGSREANGRNARSTHVSAGWVVSKQCGDLVPEHQDLDVLGCIGPGEQREPAQHNGGDRSHGRTSGDDVWSPRPGRE